MSVMFRLLILAGIILSCSITAHAQFIHRIGLDLGGTYAHTQGESDYVQYYSRAFLRKQMTSDLDLEAGIGFGLINGREYKTRLVPLDVRLHYRPLGTRRIHTRNNNLMITTPYVFSGLGSLGFRPISVASDDNPLTQEMGPSMMASSMWGFSQNWAVVVPVGIGVDFELDERAAFTTKFAYQQSSSSGLAGVTNSGAQGYFTFTVGMHFNTTRREARPVPAPAPYHINHKLIEPEVRPMDASMRLELAMNQINNARFHYDRYETQLTDQERYTMRMVNAHMKEFPQIDLEVFGHTDSLGGVELNDAVSRTRAWNVFNYMVRNEIEPYRMQMHAQGLHHPIADNNTEEGRYLNRRVEFKAHVRDGDASEAAADRWGDIEVPDFHDGQVVIGRPELAFGRMSDEPARINEQRIEELARFMQKNEDFTLSIDAWSNLYKYTDTQRALGLARANVIVRRLVLAGIAEERIEINVYTNAVWSSSMTEAEKTRHEQRLVTAKLIKHGEE